MKRTAFILLTLFFFISGCRGFRNEKGVATEEMQNKNVRVIVYFPDKEFSKLVPEERTVPFKNTVEETVVNTLISGSIKGSMQSIPKGTRIISLSRNNGNITLNLSKEFLKSLNSVSIYSIVDSLTEIPGIKGVILKSEGKPINMKMDGINLKNPIKRNRKLLARNPNLNPREVLKKQMGLEAEGKWFEAYLLMSDDENNPDRKYYNEYAAEMDEIRTLGFLNTDFEVGDYTVDRAGSKASVKVNFYTRDSLGKRVLANSVRFNTVKIDGVWLVDWLTSQS